MTLTDFLIEVVKHTNGWVIVVVFGLFIGYEVYKKHKESETVSKALVIVESSHRQLLENVSKNIAELTVKVQSLLTRLGG